MRVSVVLIIGHNTSHAVLFLTITHPYILSCFIYLSKSGTKASLPKYDDRSRKLTCSFAFAARCDAIGTVGF